MSAALLPKKILIVRLGALGDVANALTLATAIKAAAPETEIGWAVHGLALPIVAGNPAVDRTHLWDKREGGAGLVHLIRELRAARYELAIDLARIFKSGFVARLSGARRVLGFDRARSKEFAWLFAKEHIPAGDAEAHMVQQYMEFARHLGLAPDPAGPRHSLPSDAAAEAWATALVGSGPAPIGIGVGASYASKRWPTERFVALAERLAAERGLPVVLIGGPADREQARVELDALAARSGSVEPQATLAPGRVTDLVGRTSMAELVALAGQLRCYASSDTGPMHLAVARGRSVAALFGPGEAGRTGPWSSGRPDRPHHEIVRVPPDCAPCNKRVCRMPRHDCMLDIHVELVAAAVGRILDRTDEHGEPLAGRPEPTSQA